MAGFTYATLTTAIQNYTETDTNVLTATITDQFIENSELRILRDVPIDAYKKQSIGNLVTGQNTINVPAKTTIRTRHKHLSFLLAMAHYLLNLPEDFQAMDGDDDTKTCGCNNH